MNCNQINKHERDALIKFEEVSHTYTVNGKVLKSVTTLIGECFEQFDDHLCTVREVHTRP